MATIFPNVFPIDGTGLTPAVTLTARNRIGVVGEFSKGPANTYLSISQYNDFANGYGVDLKPGSLFIQSAKDQGATNFGIVRVTAGQRPATANIVASSSLTSAANGSITLSIFKIVAGVNSGSTLGAPVSKVIVLTVSVNDGGSNPSVWLPGESIIIDTTIRGTTVRYSYVIRAGDIGGTVGVTTGNIATGIKNLLLNKFPNITPVASTNTIILTATAGVDFSVVVSDTSASTYSSVTQAVQTALTTDTTIATVPSATISSTLYTTAYTGTLSGFYTFTVTSLSAGTYSLAVSFTNSATGAVTGFPSISVAAAVDSSTTYKTFKFQESTVSPSTTTLVLQASTPIVSGSAAPSTRAS